MAFKILVARKMNLLIAYASQLCQKVFEGFQSLRGSPPELYRAFILKFLDSFSYFSFSLIFTLFLSKDFGYSDLSAGTIYGAWGALVTLFGLFTGVIVDNLGVATSLRVGFALQLAAKIMIFATTSRVTLLLGICLLSLGGCMGIPVLVVGIRRYTTEKNRGVAFGMFYVIMNVAALLSGPIVDYCTILYKADGDDDGGGNEQRLMEDMQQQVQDKDWILSGYRLVVLLGIFTNVAACVLSSSVKEIKVVDNEESSTSEVENGNTQEFQVQKASPYEIIKETMQSKDFWRFLVVVMITLVSECTRNIGLDMI